MAKEQAKNLINDSVLTLMEFTRKNRAPIKGFRLRDLSILFYIYSENKKEPLTMSSLAHSLKVTPAAASQIVAGYEKNGWVKRIRSTTDRRTVFIQVTDEICDKLLEKWKEHNERLDEFLDMLGEQDCENLYRILHITIEYFRSTIEREMPAE